MVALLVLLIGWKSNWARCYELNHGEIEQESGAEDVLSHRMKTATWAVRLMTRVRARRAKAVKMVVGPIVLLGLAIVAPRSIEAQSAGALKVQISIGDTAAERVPFYLRVVPSDGVKLDKQEVWEGTAGAGQPEARTYIVEYPDRDVRPISDMQTIWAYLIAHSDAAMVDRLSNDPAFRPDSRKVTFELNRDGTRGFSLTVDQLLHQKSFWIPSLDVYIAVGDSPVPFPAARRALAPYAGTRILEQIEAAPEASYSEFESRWEDMGSPAYTHPAQQGPGQIVCLTWDSTVHKFGIDRGAGVWSDYGNPDHFRFWFAFGDLADGIIPYWRGQTLENGLPIVTTVFVRDNVRYQVEQFAYPLYGPSQERRGDLKMVLMQRVRLTDLSGKDRIVPVTMVHERSLSTQDASGIIAERIKSRVFLETEAHRNVLLAVNPEGADVVRAGVKEANWQVQLMLGPGQESRRVDTTLSIQLPANTTREFSVALPSPALDAEERDAIANLDYETARKGTLEFWSAYLAQGAQFDVPEPAVNDLFRANLWHALTLPRRHTDGRLDLPYSNFAYSQSGTPWPVNQSVYVDYMLYGLRGYNKIATEEFQAIYQNNQKPNGEVSGNANWLAYTPGMLYAVAQNYLLSNDKQSFEALLPNTLKALDWSIEQIRNANSTAPSAGGLVEGPLNDITAKGFWAFNQAYLYAGVEAMGQALERDSNPRAAESLDLARTYQASIAHSMSLAAVQSPLVPLRDHTWIPYVPSDASTPGRNFEQWYPSDVDTGAVHLLRLGALPAQGELADSLLNDQEDNLFLNGWGLANEPVYSQQATAYLIRDDPKAVIRTFYSLMAGGFSHGVFEPVEHRWRWGQFFGPPSTDGAWFELYRNMLVREQDDHTLILAQAAPRAWLEDGKKISVKNAPTKFGNVSYDVRSHANPDSIDASFQLNSRETGTTVILRLRHPQGATLRRVTVNGQPWGDFDSKMEWIRIPNVGHEVYSITANYQP